MKFKLFFLILILSHAVSYYSQKETNNWYFGLQAAINFSTTQPSSMTTNVMSTPEGCTTISDKDGNLLFYSEGFTIWNRNHVVMANGNGLWGSPSSTQSSVIVKQPGNSNLYYIFTLGSTGVGALHYSVVDMNLAAGMGSVTIKNFTLASNMTEKLCATKHCNGTDYWILAHKYNSNDFYAYQFGASGVSSSPVISSIGLIQAHSISSGSVAYSGYMKFSPNGDKVGLAIGDSISTFELFEFNRLTGVLSNNFVLSKEKYVYGCEFSSDGTKFYGTSFKYCNFPLPPLQGYLMQWDLSLNSPSLVIASKLIIDSVPENIAALQLGVDEKIYVSKPSKPTLGIIQHPNNSGTSCNYINNGLSIGTSTNASFPPLCQSGLPNFVSNYFRKIPAFTQTVSCNQVAFSFPDLPPITSYSVNSFIWNFGDPGAGASNTSTLANPMHLYGSSGVYTIQLILNYDCVSDTIYHLVTINVPQVNLIGKTTICQNEKTIISANGANTFSWSTGANTSSISLSPSVTSVYTVTGTYTSNLCSNSKIFTVTVNPCTDIYENVQGKLIASIFPNPTNGVIKIEYKDHSKMKCSITNNIGQLVYTSIEISDEIDIGFLEAGIYYLKLESQIGYKVTKIIKN